MDNKRGEYKIKESQEIKLSKLYEEIKSEQDKKEKDKK